MLLPFTPLALGAIIFSSLPVALGLSPSDIPADTPVSQILSLANAKLAAGSAHEALSYFDTAIARDPKNYLTLFKRGAAYLSLGRNSLAQQDFDRVLAIKPGFEGALLQRAKINSRNGEWAAAKKDYEAAGRAGGQEIAELEEAEHAAVAAAEAAARGDWETCIGQSGVAIFTAGAALDIRKLRARCRLEKGEVMEGVSDLQHVLQISSGSVEPHLQISAMTFYSLGETEKGLAAIRKCLHSDPDSKACMKLMKREKAIEKRLRKVRQAMEKRQFNGAVKLLTKAGEDSGLLHDVKDDIAYYKDEGYIYKNSPDGLYKDLVEMTCQAYTEMNNKKRAQPYCTELFSLDPTALLGLLSKAEKQLDEDDFENAIRTLNEAKDHHPGNDRIQSLMQKAQQLLQRSKQKDYYKVLGVARDADERDIKKAYRKLTKQYHPDKAGQSGITKEEAETKMAAINEAYEVLSDPELKARFDRGDDPNSQEQGNPFQGSPFGQGPGGPQFVFRQGPGQGFQGGGGFKFQQGAGGFQFPGGFGFP